MESALAAVRAQLGREYELRIAGERFTTPDKLKSVNPSRPDEVVGIHQKATPAMASLAIDQAYSFFKAWSGGVEPAERIAMLRRTAQVLRIRKMEFDAWLVYEAGSPGRRPRPTFPRQSTFANTTRSKWSASAVLSQ